MWDFCAAAIVQYKMVHGIPVENRRSTGQVNTGKHRTVQPTIPADCAYRCGPSGVSSGHLPKGEIYRNQWLAHLAVLCLPFFHHYSSYPPYPLKLYTH